MNKEFDDILSEKLKELPLRSPSIMLCREIEAALDMEDAISRKLQDLPNHSPSPGVWETIATALQGGHETREPERILPGTSEKPMTLTLRRYLPWSQRRIIQLAAAGIAAVTLILFGVMTLAGKEHGITVESEIVLNEMNNTGMIPVLEDEDPIEVVRNLCRTGAPVCQSDIFKEKLQLYQELDNELRQLQTVISLVGDSPEIIQSVIRIENLKSGTLQELIQLIHS